MTDILTEREDWGPGPWDDEPDLIEWTSEHGVACAIVRSTLSGTLCGYVAIPPLNPAYQRRGPRPTFPDYEVHGGITFAKHGHPATGAETTDLWIGFDTCHAFDFAPGIRVDNIARAAIRLGRPLTYASAPTSPPAPARPFPGEAYRDVAYVRAEVERLAAQVAGDGAR